MNSSDAATVDEFRTAGYRRHNLCRQNHLASLHLPIAGKTVLELGAGIGDHTGFFLDRDCHVTCVEARRENIQRIHDAHPDVGTIRHNLDVVPFVNLIRSDNRWQIIYAYGILYHLNDPANALKRWAEVCSEMLLLETCVNTNPGILLDNIPEATDNPTASFTGRACRPSRLWVVAELEKHFEFVYLPVTQPDHEEFPLDWHRLYADGLTRAVFVASRTPLDNPLLTDEIPQTQLRAVI